MVNAVTAQISFTSGELSKDMRGRFDVPQYFAGCERSENFIHTTQGPVTYRPGLRYVIDTKDNLPGVFYPFKFNDEQAYSVLMMPEKAWFFADEGIVTEIPQPITNISTTNPAVVTYDDALGDNFLDGRDVVISGVIDMVEINGLVGRVANVNPGANTFELSNIDASSFATYGGGGEAAQIEEVDTPYQEEDLFNLQIGQNADTMYITNTNYPTQVLTRVSASEFDLSEIVFDYPPFDAENETDITLTPSATTGNITVTASAALFASTDVDRFIWFLEEGVGEGYMQITSFTDDQTVGATVIQDLPTTAAQTTWRLGAFSETTGYPGATTFYEQRLVFAGTISSPQTIYFSQSGKFLNFDLQSQDPVDSSAVNYTIGSRDVNLIRFMSGMQNQMMIGTFGGNFVVKGGQGDEAITPTSISIKPADGVGGENQIPILRNNEIIFTERGQRTLRSFRFEFTSDDFRSIDLNILSEDITLGNIKQISFQNGRPEVVWCVKEDGDIVTMTYKPEENVVAWGRVITRDGDEFFSITNQSREGNFDQPWCVVIRDGVYRVEYFTDLFNYADPLDFYTGKANQDSDQQTFLNLLFEQQKQYIHLDSSLTYDGSLVTLDANVAVTPAATTGTGIIFTADTPFFTAAMQNREIWKKSLDGTQTGRAEITSFNSTTEVECTIKEDFDSTDQIAAGDWYLTTDTVTGLNHVEGNTVQVIVDGSTHPDETVTNNEITVDNQHSVIHVGYGYRGLIKTMNLEVGGIAGPSQASFKNVFEIGVKMVDTILILAGTTPYNLEQLLFRNNNSRMNNPPQLFTGTKKIDFADSFYDGPDHQPEKKVVIVQDSAVPATISQLIPFVNTQKNS